MKSYLPLKVRLVLFVVVLGLFGKLILMLLEIALLGRIPKTVLEMCGSANWSDPDILQARIDNIRNLKNKQGKA